MISKNCFDFLDSPGELGSVPKAPWLRCGTISADQTAVVGVNDWLFLYGGTNDYYQSYHLPLEIARSNVDPWLVRLAEYRQICDRLGIRFLTVIIPNKATILSQYYPLGLGDAITPRLQMIMSAMGPGVFCPVVELRSSSVGEFAFRRNDSHLTEFGNLYIVDQLLKAFSLGTGNLCLPAETVFRDNVGDLGRRFDPALTEIVPRFRFGLDSGFQYFEISPPSGVHTGLIYETSRPSAPIRARLLVFGNSFFDRPTGWSIAPYFCRLFTNVRFHWESGVYESEIAAFNPDIVLFQTCERFLGSPPRSTPFAGKRVDPASIPKPHYSPKEKSMKLLATSYLQSTGGPLPCSLFVFDSFIGSMDRERPEFPWNQLVRWEREMLEYGVTAVSSDSVTVASVDVSEYVDAYLGENRLLTRLQGSVCAGKWSLYAFRPKPNNVVEADFGVVLPVSLMGQKFSIRCDGRSPVRSFYSYDRHFGASHWFMPAGCVIGVRHVFEMDRIPPYLDFTLSFDNVAFCDQSRTYRTQVIFTDPRMLEGLPDLGRIQRVASKNANKNSFMNGGRSAYVALSSIAKEHGVALDSPQLSVLDWGVGCGRVIRHFAELPAERLVGIDIDEDNIGWCRANLRGEYECVSPTPPTGFAADSFDLIYSCSVLSHLSAYDAGLWLEEMRRLLRPGGIALISFNGLSTSATYLSRRPSEFKRVLDGQLFDSDVNHELDGYIPGRDYYRASFASDEWWRVMFERYLNIVDVELSVLNGFQNVAVLRK